MTARRGVLRARRLLAAATSAALLMSLLGALPAAAVEPGDEPETAVPIAEIGVPQDYDTSAATENPAVDPTDCDGEFGQVDGPFTETFWHAFTPAASGDLIVDVNSFPDPEAQGFLAIVFVYSGSPGNLSLVGCNAFGSTVRFEATAGTTYYAMTGSLPETPGGGPATISVVEPFLAGITVASRASYDPQSNVVTIHGTATCLADATLEVSVFARQSIGQHAVLGAGGGFVPSCEGDTSWTAELEGFTSFFNPGSLDVFVDVFACTILCVGDSTEATVTARPTNNRPGPASPPPPPPPANDERDGAFPIVIDESATQDTTGATSNETDPTLCPDDDIVPFSNSTVWYEFTAPADGFVEVNTFDSDYDTTLFVLDGDTLVACNDQAADTNQSQLVFEATAGVTYALMIGAWENSPPGNLVLTVLPGEEPPPPPPPFDPATNDELDDAIALVIDGPAVESNTSATTVNLDTDPQECPVEGFPPSSHTVWYTVTASADQFVEINTFGSAYDTTLYVLDESGEVIACNDDAVDVQSRVVFAAVADGEYTVMVGSFAESPGGNLVIRALTSDTPPPPPPPVPIGVELSINPVVALDTRTGAATLSGEITCSVEATGSAFAGLSQSGGRFSAEGFGEGEVACGPEPTTWTIVVFGDTSRFQNGAAFASIEAGVESEDGGFGDAFAEGEVTLRPAGRAR